jgi:spore germination cell wall hydrolase CwlJ-like protein
MSAAVCLALAIFLEGGIEPPQGQIAVGWSVVNSSTTLHKRPHRICTEVFSGRYMAVNSMGEFPKGERWRQTIILARDILSGRIPDPTGGAQFFECTKWASCKKVPWWSVGMEVKGLFGSQHFFKDTR